MLSVAQIYADISASSRLSLSPNILVINGCHSGCASECISNLGYTDFDEWDVKKHLELNGYPVNEAHIEKRG
jgi:uncharacterized metal-binding protein